MGAHLAVVSPAGQDQGQRATFTIAREERAAAAAHAAAALPEVPLAPATAGMLITADHRTVTLVAYERPVS
jgi:hypothetical protein